MVMKQIDLTILLRQKLKKKKKNIDLNFSKISILLDIKKLNLFIKFISPQIEFKSVKIPLEVLRANVELGFYY